MHEITPAGFAFVLDIEKLKAPNIYFFSAWNENKVAGIGALKVNQEYGEIKSMRTHPNFLRKGVAKKMLDHLIEFAKTQGLKKIFLETGIGEGFGSANSFYVSQGFNECGAFGDYEASPHNKFYELNLK
jgi:putative acetyltransferase